MRSFINTLFVTVAIGTTLALAGCQNSSSSPAPGAKVYDVKGKIVSLDAGKKVVTLDHEDIPGFMKAMTMEFAVADAKVLDGLKAGDAVQGKIKSEGGTYAVTSLEKR
jgi:Cu/Ag efflux protein CusF